MILVTGATGFVGRSLVRLLEREERPFKPYYHRINNPVTLRAELDGVTGVVHLASAEARGRPRALQHVDVEGTERLLEEALRAGVDRFVYVSRLNADFNSSFPLLRAKGEAERLVQQSGLSYTILRSATLFGREDRFVNVVDHMLNWSWPIAWLPNRGRMAMQPLWVEDFVRCLIMTLNRPDLIGRTVILAGEERLTYQEIVTEILLATGRFRVMLPMKLIVLRLVALTAFGWRLRPPVSRFFIDRFSVPEVAALDSVLRHFGFRPQRMSEHLAHLRRTGFRL